MMRYIIKHLFKMIFTKLYRCTVDKLCALSLRVCLATVFFISSLFGTYIDNLFGVILMV